jgi:hypothetical protein
VPLLSVGQDGHRHALVEGVLEKLVVGPLALPDLLDLYHDEGLARRVAQSVVHSTTAQ